MSNKKIIFTLRNIFVHFIFILYCSLLWWKLIEIGLISNYKSLNLIIICVVWSCAFLTINFVSGYLANKERPPKYFLKTWLNIPMLTFVVLNLPPYGFTLNHIYGTQENDYVNLQDYSKNITCIEHKSRIPDFIILQMAMPVLLLTFLIYPLPQRAYSGAEYLAIALEFMNAFDIMDMVPDIFYIRGYGNGWFVIFYASLGISVIMLSFPVKIETDDIFWPDLLIKTFTVAKNVSNENSFSLLNDPHTIVTTNTAANKQSILSMQQSSTIDKKALKYRKSIFLKMFKSFFTIIFMDGCFALIRFKIMISENSAEIGFNMFVKNVILATLHLNYFLKHLRNLISLNKHLKHICEENTSRVAKCCK
ncbi:uncharacterized protein LOC105844167 isoform X2 [Hydra vulgaris]|uniref:Uncharacterized protein LOC105844167 isoform X2 n=1 Tax=Hydra vulgaris TaxID=6087 RepID=A0ABM4BG11_HYDVU